jgi:anthranilate synthase/aminodeoxychorismate synthase-like glutamine amidotransferase
VTQAIVREDNVIAVIDNYDSFTYNLVQYLGELGADLQVFRNDAITIEELAALQPEKIVISPGPGDPDDGGISNQAIRRFSGRVPILGVCLGHQCIGAVFGGVVKRAPQLMHGKTSQIYHNGKGIFDGLPSPFAATRYHSLMVEEPVANCLEVTAFTNDGVVMGVQHKEHHTYGVQFHPESILTKHGKQLLKNFLSIKRGSP